MGYKKNCGIYEIVNLINKKRYIGSTNCLQRRWLEHKSTLNRKVHGNEYLQNSWNKYGMDNFIFNILEHCNEENLKEREKYWMTLYDSLKRSRGYNISSAERHNMSDETKFKLSKAHKNKVLSDETKHKLSVINTGRRFKLSSESREKISAGKKGKAFSLTHRENLSKSHLGKKYTEKQTESRKNMILKGQFDKKLSYVLACEIREKYKKGGLSQKKLGLLYNVSSRTIFDVIHNKYHVERDKI